MWLHLMSVSVLQVIAQVCVNTEVSCGPLGGRWQKGPEEGFVGSKAAF